jgi:hypothetical protein
VGEELTITGKFPYLVIFTFYKRHIHIVGRWTYIFILLSIKNIYTHKMYFGMTMFTCLGGRHFNNFARAWLEQRNRDNTKYVTGMQYTKWKMIKQSVNSQIWQERVWFEKDFKFCITELAYKKKCFNWEFSIWHISNEVYLIKHYAMTYWGAEVQLHGIKQRWVVSFTSSNCISPPDMMNGSLSPDRNLSSYWDMSPGPPAHSPVTTLSYSGLKPGY